jgi:hypothetical protein
MGKSLIDRHERLIRPFSVYDANPARGFRMFLQLHREYMSVIRSTDFSGCTPGTKSELPSIRELGVQLIISYSIDV